MPGGGPSVITTGSGNKLGVTLYVALEISEMVMLMLYTGTIEVVTAGYVMTWIVVMTTEPNVSVKVVVTGGYISVMSVVNVYGGRMKLHGGSHVIVGVGSFQISGSMETSPEPPEGGMPVGCGSGGAPQDDCEPELPPVALGSAPTGFEQPFR